MLRRAPAGARPRGPEAHHVEDRPLAHQGEDAGARRPARGRDERAHVLRGRLVRLRRRALRRGPAAPLRRRAGRPAVAPARGSPAQRVDPRDPHPLPGRAQVRRRGARRTLLRGALPGVDTRRRADLVSGRLGAAPGVEHAAGPGAALRGGERRRTPRLPGRSRRLAPRRGRRAVTPARRRRAFVWAAAALVIALVGGRWLAIETAERAWAATVTGGDLYLAARDLARLVQGIILLVSLTWGIGNLYIVYRAIGSVQLPRRLGDLEIVEAVPQRGLLRGTLPAGARGRGRTRGCTSACCPPLWLCPSPGPGPSIPPRRWPACTARSTRPRCSSGCRGQASSSRSASSSRWRVSCGACASSPRCSSPAGGPSSPRRSRSTSCCPASCAAGARRPRTRSIQACWASGAGSSNWPSGPSGWRNAARPVSPRRRRPWLRRRSGARIARPALRAGGT